MADVHIGGWKEPAMSRLGLEAFGKAIDESIIQGVDFAIIAGDLFNTSLPNIDYIKETVKHLKKLKQKNIPVYMIPGSHDYSPTGKTMLDVLEQADLMINVVKAKQLDNGKIQLILTEDKKTGALLTGMLGKKNMLERSYYESLDTSNLNNPGFKIFLFHSAIDELKPEAMAKMESSPISLLPKGFDYYAGGHVHIVEHKNLEGYKNVIYPGPIFPNSFSELQKLRYGTYYIYDNGNISCKKLELKQVLDVEIDCNNKTPEQVTSELKRFSVDNDFKGKIVLIKLSGKLKLGKLMDIDLKSVINVIHGKDAYFVMKNTSSVTSSDFEEIKKDFKPELLEEDVISEHIGQVKIEGIDPSQEKGIIMQMIKVLSSEKNEGETNTTYEDRLLNDIDIIR